MGALALGIVLIIGYFFQSNHPSRRLELYRAAGYHIYFKAGLSGFLFLTLSIIAWSIIDYYDWPSSLLNYLKITDNLVFLQNLNHWDIIKAVAIFVLMFFISSSVICFRLLFKTKKSSLKKVLKVAHELERLIIEATTHIKPIRIELDCGKVYIGIPETPNLERGEVKYISILPLLSGYADAEKKIIFNNNYYRHYESFYNELSNNKTNEHSNIEDFLIVLPVNDIVIASKFSIEAFISFRASKNSELIGPPKP